ncbi:hypothetical protein Q3C01_00400 [Bradyrhizobium sp. UFLA05-109]
MFRRRKKSSRAHDAQSVQQRNDRDYSSGKDIQARIVQLRSVPREKLADAVFMLSMAAKQQSWLIRQSINERAKSDFDFDPPSSGDPAAYLAEDTVSTLRHHIADGPTLLDLLSGGAPAVHFTVHQRDAVSMLAALIREQRLEGILEGLRLAGLLNESSKDRHAGFSS